MEVMAAKNEHLENPLHLDGLEFIEFAAPKAEELEKLFSKWGFQKIGQHKRKAVTLYRQNQINFVINAEPGSFAHKFGKAHGASICATGFRVKNALKAFDQAVARGARPVELKSDPASHSFPAVYGVGETAIYFIDRYKDRVHYDDDFRYLQSDRQPKGKGLLLVDHLTQNVPAGDLEKWCEFYRSIFVFRELHDFKVAHAADGIHSKVMRSPCGKITIPIQEPSDKTSQIQTYLDQHHGSGVQTLALLTSEIISVVGQLRQEGIEFIETSDSAYYESLAERLPNVTENISTLKQLKILADGNEHGYLLQIFTKPMIGPIFFEIVQRGNYDGLGKNALSGRSSEGRQEIGN